MHEPLSRWSCQSPAAHSCSLLNHRNSFCRGMFKLNAKFDADLLLYLLSHFECMGPHTVHLLTQRHLPLPLTSTVKSSLFTHTHSGPFSLAARLHRCYTNHTHYINFGWTFSRQTSYNCHSNNIHSLNKSNKYLLSTKLRGLYPVGKNPREQTKESLPLFYGVYNLTK